MLYSFGLVVGRREEDWEEVDGVVGGGVRDGGSGGVGGGIRIGGCSGIGLKGTVRLLDDVEDPDG